MKNALFDHLSCYKIKNNDPVDEEIGKEVSLIKFFKIRFRNSDSHDSNELSNVVNLDFLARKWCLKIESLQKNVNARENQI